MKKILPILAIVAMVGGCSFATTTSTILNGMKVVEDVICHANVSVMGDVTNGIFFMDTNPDIKAKASAFYTLLLTIQKTGCFIVSQLNAGLADFDLAVGATGLKAYHAAPIPSLKYLRMAAK